MSYDTPVVPPPMSPAPSGGTSTALILGIIGLVGNVSSCCCCLGLLPGLCSPVAWWMGARELRAIRSGFGSPQAESNARTGMICGIVGTALLVLYVGAVLVYIAVVGFAVAAESLKEGRIPVR